MTEEQFDHIERYGNGQMTEDEIREVEAKIANDSDWQSAYEAYQMAQRAIQGAAFETQRSRIKQLDQQPARTNWTRYGTVAAAAVVIFTLIYVLMPGPDYQQLAQDYFEPYPDRVSIMGEQASTESAMEAYEKGDFREAIQQLEALPPAHKTSLTQLYVGICWVALDSCAQAREVLTPLSTATTNTSEAAQWYLILAHLQCDDASTAKTLLTAYLDNATIQFNRDKATALLEQLD